MVEIGFHASHEQHPPSALLAAVRLAERAGFDAAMCSDHLAPWGVAQGESGHAWSWLGAAMATTSFGFGVVASPGQRQHPAVVAQAIATLGELFPGRFWAALGSGEAVNEHVTGGGWPAKPVRERRLEQSATAIAALLRGEEVDVDDEIVVHRARVWSRPATPPPILAAAVSPATAARVAPWADGLITVLQSSAVLVDVVDAYRSAGGAGPIALQAHVRLGDDEREAVAEARAQWRHCAVPAPLLWDLEQPEDFDAAATDLDEARLREAVLIETDADVLAERLAGLVRIGFDRLHLHDVGLDQLGFVERAATQLLPALRSRCAADRGAVP